ncbi:MAG: restriction endonuclease subunit S [Agitococcus sp.]|nr:restriction endonuclease subunit S [Agitococcus sp.]
MSFDWPKVKLQEVTTKLGDGLHGTPVYDEQGDYHFINGNNLENGWIAVSEKTKKTSKIEYLKHKKELNDRTVLVSINGTIGNVALYRGEKVFLGKSACYFNVVDTVDKGFVFYVMVSRFFQDYINSMATGSTIKNVSLQLMRDFEFHLPPLTEQKEIASILSALDNRISLLREANTTLEAIAQTLFKSWFVDFDPVKAKAEGRLPEGMDEATAALFPSEFEESALGLIPKGWRVGTLGDIAQTVKKQLQTSELNTDLLYVGLEHIPRQSLSLTNWDNAEGLGSAKSVFSKGDILFGKLRPYFHKVVIAPFDGVCSTDILICQPKHKTYYGLVTMYLYSSALVDYAARLSNGAKMPRINWKDLSDYPICIPPESLAAEYSQVVIPLFERMTEGVHQSQTLTTLRDTLLPRLISGQLRLNQAQDLVDEVEV